MSDFIAASCVGVAQVCVGHPFDTTLTLIQNKKSWRSLPFTQYYRGWKYPLCSSVIFNMSVFPFVERSQKYTGSIFLSGALAGVCVAPAMFCFEFGKIKQQTKQEVTLRDMMRNTGRFSILSREVVAMSSYFGMYNYMREKDFNFLTSGGAAGLANWTLTYPIEVVKNRQLAQNISIRQALAQKNLWKGYPICATRATLVNAVNFWTYETVKNFVEKINVK
jgi:hypothetical protein